MTGSSATTKMKTTTTATLIKGYLPVRLKIDGSQTLKHKQDETFFFVREHQTSNRNNIDHNNNDDDDDHHAAGESTKKSFSSSKTGAGCTLFVANVPVVKGIATDILLKSIFGRFGDINRVTAIENPRRDTLTSGSGTGGGGNSNSNKNEIPSSWTSMAQDPTFLPHISSVGKFAHIVYKSPKDMRRSLRALQETMSPSKNQEGLHLEKIEIQTLSDETHRRYLQQEKDKKKAINNRNDSDSNEDDDSDDFGHKKKEKYSKGIVKVAARFRNSCTAVSREALLEECNTVMQAYEDAETENKTAQEVAKSQPDEDGFVTVTNADAAGRRIDLEEGTTSSSAGRKRNKRSRKKKKVGADSAEELQDFYRFQRRDTRKRSLEMLRKQFEDDLSKVKKMKNENHYRPFG